MFGYSEIEAQILLLFHKLSHYKPSGLDAGEIPIIVLQKPYTLIANHLLHIFQPVLNEEHQLETSYLSALADNLEEPLPTPYPS